MIRALLERRVPQFVALYVVGGWGFVQFIDWAVEQYFLSPTITNIVVTLLLLFLPTVAMIAWRHGAPGDDPWRATDAGLIGVNAVLSAAIVFGLFRGEALGRTADVRLLETPEGEIVERTIARPEARKRLHGFNFTNETGDPSLDWLGPGVSLGIAADLIQDPFVYSTGPESPYPAERIREAGLGPRDDLPLALMRDLSRAQRMDYFIDGTIERAAGDSLIVRTRLYETETLRVVAEHTYPLDDPLDAADRISVDMRADMGVPSIHVETSPDLPVAEFLTRSPDAFRALVEAEAAQTRGDASAMAEAAERAVALDSTSVMGHFMLGMSALLQGDNATYAASVQRALVYDYRLPERLRLALRANSQVWAERDIEAALRTVDYWAEAYPGDPQARVIMAELHALRGNDEARIQALREAVEIDPTFLEPIRALAFEQRALGEYDEAIASFRELRDLQPGNPTAMFQVAGVLRDAGRFEEARDVYEEARTLAPRDPDGPRLLGVMEMYLGNRDEAEALRAEAGALARTTQERERIAGWDETRCYFAGQFECLESAYRVRLGLLADREFNIPANLLWDIDNSEYLRYAVEFGREAEALAQIDSLARSVTYPDDYPVHRPAASLAIYGGDLEAARRALDTLRMAATDLPRDTRVTRWFEAWPEGYIAWWEDGDCRRALASFERLPELLPGNFEGRRALLQCYTALERWDDAQAAADWIMVHWPGWVTLRLEIARYEVARGRPERAIEHLDFALDAWAEADPEYRPAQEARALREELVASG